MMRAILPVAALLALAACGSRSELRPPEGRALPVRPYGAPATPTPRDLLTASPQARPLRSDEPLRQSERRERDEFALPPN